MVRAMRAACWAQVAVGILCSVTAEAGVVRGQLELPRQIPGRDSALIEAVVYVDSLPEALMRKWGRQRSRLRIIQQNRRFLPRVVAVVAGTTVRFQNKDDVYHNVFSVSPAKRFDLGKYPPRAVNQVTFDRPGVVNLYCDIHPGMAAYVLVLPHRLFTRPDRSGAFALPSLPPGEYTLRVWHPLHGEIEKRIVVPPRGDLRVELSF